MGNEKNNLDDLISSSGGAPIIVQESGGDKKILYILLIALLILFILAIGLIAFLGGKYFSQNENGKVAQKSAVVAPVEKESPKKVENTTVESVKASKKEVSDLEKMVAQEEAKKASQAVEKSEPKTSTAAVQSTAAAQAKPATKEEKAIQKAATATTGKTLSQEDLAKIAALVAQELAKTKVVTAPQSAVAKSKQASSSAQDDAALAAQLEQAQTDTLKNEQEVTKDLKGNVKAGSKKKVDTFNKVIVNEKRGSDDELSKLSQEIDAILQSEDVQKSKKNKAYVKELSQEIKQREKEMRFIVVKKGDTLSSIAYRAYGRASAYVKIYEANPDIIRNPNRIYVGMKLRVPVDEEYKKQQGE